MQKSITSLRDELAGLRTGRASASLLEPVTVEAYGSRMPLNQVATVTVPEPRMLSVQVWDRGMANAVEKAIRDSGPGLNPGGGPGDPRATARAERRAPPRPDQGCA
jgi:ribosome recycling factor